MAVIATVKEKLAFLTEYRTRPEKYRPLIDHAWQTFPHREPFGVVNVGWDVGIIDGNRPYFCECWADGVTILTYFISTQGIEDYSVEQIDELLKREGIVWYREPRKYKTAVKIFHEQGNEFFSINIIVGDDDGTYIDGGIIYGLQYLNEYNEARNKSLF